MYQQIIMNFITINSFQLHNIYENKN